MNNNADKSEWYGMLTECRKRMSVSEIARRLGKSIPTITKWLNNDVVMRDSEKICEMLAKLLDETRFSPNPDPRQRLWQSLRIKKVVGSHELAIVSLTDMSTAYRFLRFLTKCGYLQKFSSHRKNEGSLWKLVRDTGPKVPFFNSVSGYIYDRNLDAEVAA